MAEQRFEDPQKKAWMVSFFDENHLNYATSPELVASPAQVRFMVYLQPDERFYPCSERIFEEVMARKKSPLLGEMYNQVWSRIFNLVESKMDDPEKRAFLIDLLNIKFDHETANYNTLPSRVEKRLFKLFMVTTMIEDPLAREKETFNRRAANLYDSPDFVRAVNHPPGPHTPAPCFSDVNVESVRRHLDATKLRRLFQASVQTRLWESEYDPPDFEQWQDIFDRPVTSDGWEDLENFLLTPVDDLVGHWVPRRILYLANRTGEIVFDLAVIQFLIRLGHTVIMAVKNAAIYDVVYLGDLENDPVLRRLTEDAELITDSALGKNQLAAALRNDKPFKLITDGTMEKLNLLRTSATFARVFKEVDGVISKGADQRRRFFLSPFEFTQDVYNLSPAENSGLSVQHKPICPRVTRFTTSDLEDKAQDIIDQMREAKRRGMIVIFYSGIVGSVPGETETAIQVMTTFIEDLERQQAGTMIINPAKFFEKGMDADDLMYMWEIVQRSGLIDIWRFQSYQDIEHSFALLGRKVPPQWVGKDATYSTGSTKERSIAADVQKSNPEMQIIGPDLEKFLRRGEYGIGLFHDTRLVNLYQP
ncbi:MAG: DUF89 family protein [Proteobacteria bacterium]|nr:DUF89 family protein [Pseudomonadota bacterium]